MASQPYQLMELGTTGAGFDLGTTQVMELGTSAADFQNNVRERQTAELGAPDAGFDIVTITLRAAQVLDLGTEDAGFDVIATLPADTRTGLSLAGVANRLQPITPFPIGVPQRTPYGTVTTWMRQFNCKDWRTAQAAMADVLAFGSHIRPRWIDEYCSLRLDGPKVQSLSAAAKGTDVVLTAVYAAIALLGAYTDGYNATRKLMPKGAGAFGDEGVSYGIAPSRTATGIPKAGDIITAYQAYDLWRCTGTAFDEDALPGRVLVEASWVRHKKETSIVEPTDG